MKFKALAIPLLALLLALISSNPVGAHGGGGSGSNSGSGGSGDENRVRIEVRTGEDEPDENRVRVELRGDDANVDEAMNLINQLEIPADVNRVRVETRDDGDRVRIELRGAEVEEVDALPDIEIEGNNFEITGEVTAFSEGTVTIDGQTITIDPSQVTNFEQEGTIEVGEIIKVEGIVQDGTLLAREIKANGVEAAVEVGEGFPMDFLNQILIFIQNLV